MSAAEFLKDGKWACNKCGACCSYVRPLFKKYPAYKRWLRWDGSCLHLKSDMTCNIYESRPEICKVNVTLKNYTDQQKAEMCSEMKLFKETR